MNHTYMIKIIIKIATQRMISLIKKTFNKWSIKK